MKIARPGWGEKTQSLVVVTEGDAINVVPMATMFFVESRFSMCYTITECVTP